LPESNKDFEWHSPKNQSVMKVHPAVTLDELSRTPLKDEMREHVLILSDEPEAPLLTEVPSNLNRPVRIASAEALAEAFQIESGPWLLVLNLNGTNVTTAYSGGYAKGQLSPMNPSHFADIRNSLLQNDDLQAHKGFGCSVGRNASAAKSIFEARKVRRFFNNTFGIDI
jgi:hypothetical protein